jgi:hypothetical protein
MMSKSFVEYLEEQCEPKKNNKELYTKLLQTYGDKQIIIAIEELSELQKELCKSLRNKTNFHNILEEIVDVEIMVEQMKIYFDIHEEDVEAMKEYKLERTKERLGL